MEVCDREESDISSDIDYGYMDLGFDFEWDLMIIQKCIAHNQPSPLTGIWLTEQLALWGYPKKHSHYTDFPVLHQNENTLSCSFNEHIVGLMGIKRCTLRWL